MKQLRIIQILILVVAVVVGCKKKDTCSIRNQIDGQVYTGDYAYPGRYNEPYSMQFNNDGSMIFTTAYNGVTEYSGTYSTQILQ